MPRANDRATFVLVFGYPVFSQNLSTAVNGATLLVPNTDLHHSSEIT